MTGWRRGVGGTWKCRPGEPLKFRCGCRIDQNSIAQLLDCDCDRDHANTDSISCGNQVTDLIVRMGDPHTLAVLHGRLPTWRVRMAARGFCLCEQSKDGVGILRLRTWAAYPAREFQMTAPVVCARNRTMIAEAHSRASTPSYPRLCAVCR